MFKASGTFLYYLLWPLVWFYAPLRVRVRVLLVVDSQVVVVKNWFGPNSWQFPGGGMKVGESAVDTALRETSEEFGINLDKNTAQQLTEEPAIVRANGLLFRYHYVLFRADKRPDFVISKEIVDTSWVQLKTVKLPSSVSSRLI